MDIIDSFSTQVRVTKLFAPSPVKEKISLLHKTIYSWSDAIKTPEKENEKMARETMNKLYQIEAELQGLMEDNVKL